MDTTTNISGTWSKKQRPNCGLDVIAKYMHANRLTRVPVVGYVEFHQFTETVSGNTLTVAIPAIEPGMTEDGDDPDGLGRQLWEILDKLRRRQRKGAVADTLFSVSTAPASRASDDDKPAELDGQMPLVPEVRVGSDGPREVPPPSGEELTAELDERRKATGKTRAQQETDGKADLRRRVTGSSEPADPPADAGPTVPAAVFTGNTE